MTEALKAFRQFLTDRNFKVKGKNRSMRSRSTRKKRPRGESPGNVFSEGMEEATGDLGILQASWETVQITMYAQIDDESRSEVAAPFVWDGEGHSNEVWTIAPIFFFDDTLFKVMLRTRLVSRAKHCQPESLLGS